VSTFIVRAEIWVFWCTACCFDCKEDSGGRPCKRLVLLEIIPVLSIRTGWPAAIFLVRRGGFQGVVRNRLIMETMSSQKVMPQVSGGGSIDVKAQSLGRRPLLFVSSPIEVSLYARLLKSAVTRVM
jgi:hypothetical protein